MKKKNKPGQSPPLKYGEKTKIISFRVPLSKEDQLRSVANKKLKEWADKWSVKKKKRDNLLKSKKKIK